MIYSWVKKYQELGYNGLISKPKGRPKIMKPETKKVILINEDEKEKRIRELEERNAQLEMEVDLLKKLKALVQQRTQQPNKKK
jgi:transposase